MEELLRISKENNELLKDIKATLDRITSSEYMYNQDVNRLISNIVANLLFYKSR